MSPDTWSIGAIAPVGGATINISAVVLGISSIADATVVNSLYNCQVSGTTFEWSNVFMGTNTWVGYKKTGVVYYTDASDTMTSLCGKESTYGRFS
jgi:hypothetical protein